MARKASTGGIPATSRCVGYVPKNESRGFMSLSISWRKALGRAAVFTALAATLCAGVAQEVIPDFYKGPGLDPNRKYVNQNFNEHIDPFNGSLQLHYVDIHVPGNGGFDIQVTRSYNSASVSETSPSAFFGSAGVGWTVHFGRVLFKATVGPCGGSLWPDVLRAPVLELPDGSSQLLAVSSTPGATLLSTQRWRADCTGSGMVVYSPDGVRYDMTQAVSVPNGTPSPSSAYYTTAITDRNGNRAAIAYTQAGSPEVSNITTTDGRRIDFSYLPLAGGELTRRINTITSRDPTGDRIFTYGYQAVAGNFGAFQLASVTRPGGTQWQYRYLGNLNASVPGGFRLNGVTYPEGGTISYGYGSSWTDYVFFDSNNAQSRTTVVKTKTTSDGGNWSFSYSPGSLGTYDTTTVNTPSGLITYRHVGPNYATSGSLWMVGLLMQKQSGSLQTETYTWTSQPISSQQFKRPGAWQATRFDSTTNAPLLASRTIVRDGVSYSTSFSSFDAYGNPRSVSEAGPNGGNRTTSLTYFYNTALWVVRQVKDETTVGVGAVIRTLDSVGNLLAEVRDGVTTSYTRLASGDINTITRPRGLQSTYSNYYRGVPQNESHPEGVTVSRAVTASGNVSSETNGELRTTTYQYDGLNRLTRINPPAGNPTILSYTATTKTAARGALVQTTTVDGFSRTTNVSTGGQSVSARYDSLGRKIFASIVGFPTVGHSFQYDLLNRATRITHSADASYRSFTYSASGGVPTLAVRDERNYITTHAYRAYGDPDKPLVMSIAAPVAAANVTMARNGRGLVTSATQAGITRQFNYDSRFYLTSTVHPEVGTTLYGRDAAGNMTSKQVGASGTTVFDYDGRNRLWRVTYPNGSPSQVINTYSRTDRLRTVANGVATRTYGYDNNQNLTSESLVVDGLTLAATYNYNANDQLSSIVYPVLGRTIQFNPDVLGRPTSVVTPSGSMLNTSFWPNGQIYDIAYAGGSRVTYGQNTRGWLNTITVRTGGDNVTRVASTLSYDVAGNLYNVADSVDASFNRSFIYDGINRLTTVNGPWGNGSVTYNGAGNIGSYVLGPETRSYAYDSQNRLTSVTTLAGGSSSVSGYGYDVYGNASPVLDAYAYDGASNLVMAGAGRINAYDGTNVRVKTSYGGVTTYEFRSAHGLLLAEWRKQSGYYDTLKEHMHVAGKEVAEQRTDFLPGSVLAPSWMFLQPDASGSTISATWAGGGLLFKENYQPYGSQINGTAAGYTQRAFAGHKQDKPDLIYMGGRYYNPVIGRFLSIDPKEADPSDLHSLNRYAYANNNPYRYVDPDGNSPVDLAFFAVDAVRLGVAIYTGGDVAGAAIDLGMSAIGVLSPVPGTGQALKVLRTADKVVDGVKGADHVVDAAKGAGGPKFHSRYADGTPVMSGQQPPRIGGPVQGAEGAHSVLRTDTVNNRIYQAREFDAAGRPVRDIDFTSPTYPNGALRPDHAPAPHQHPWIVNDPAVGPRSGFRRGPGESLP